MGGHPRGRKVKPGSITFVGSGPGDPGLLTTRARAVLANAACVFTDPDVPEAVLKLGDVIRAVASGELGVERIAPKPKPRHSKTERSSFESRRARPRKGSR